MPDRAGRMALHHTPVARRILNGKTGEFTVILPSGNNHGPVGVTNILPLRLRRRRAVPSAGHDLLRVDASERCAGGADATDAWRRRCSTKSACACFRLRKTGTAATSPTAILRGRTDEFRSSRASTRCSSQHLEQRVGQLRSLGIEADVILFDPYDKGRWGFDRMDAATDDRYIRYIVARLGAYRNVWWSLANRIRSPAPETGIGLGPDFPDHQSRRSVSLSALHPPQHDDLQQQPPVGHAREHPERIGGGRRGARGRLTATCGASRSCSTR